MVKAVKLLEEAGLDGARERLMNFPHQFSGGQLQRIGIALALAQDCDLLIADEPTTALDVTIQRQIIDLLAALQKKRGISIIFISHDIDLVSDISGRIMVMYGGLVMESGTAETVRGAPRHPYTQALLAASPRFGSHHSREKLVPIPGKVPENTGDAAAGGAFSCPFAPRCSRARSECTKSVPLRVLRAPHADAGSRHEVRCVLAEAE
jgi:peptide/nickel transport system permease protein